MVNQQKKQMLVTESTKSLNNYFLWLRATMIQRQLLHNHLLQKKQTIKELDNENAILVEQITNAQQQQIAQDALVEEARSELKQTESRMNQEVEEKNNEIEMKRIKLLIQNSEYGRRFENLQMANEDEISKVSRLEAKYNREI